MRIKPLLSLLVVLCLLTMTACVQPQIEKFDDRNDEPGEKPTTQTEEKKSYPIVFYYYNVDPDQEEDTIVIYDDTGEVYYVGFVPENGSRTTEIPVPDYIVSSKFLGKIRVNLDEGEKAIVSVDYAANTIDYEVEEITKTNESKG